MKTIIAALGTALVLATSASAMVSADLTNRDIAEGANGTLAMGDVQVISTSGAIKNEAHGLGASTEKTITSFETSAIEVKAGDYR